MPALSEPLTVVRLVIALSSSSTRCSGVLPALPLSALLLRRCLARDGLAPRLPAARCACASCRCTCISASMQPSSALCASDGCAGEGCVAAASGARWRRCVTLLLVSAERPKLLRRRPAWLQPAALLVRSARALSGTLDPRLGSVACSAFAPVAAARTLGRRGCCLAVPDTTRCLPGDAVTRVGRLLELRARWGWSRRPGVPPHGDAGGCLRARELISGFGDVARFGPVASVRVAGSCSEEL